MEPPIRPQRGLRVLGLGNSLLFVAALGMVAVAMALSLHTLPRMLPIFTDTRVILPPVTRAVLAVHPLVWPAALTGLAGALVIKEIFVRDRAVRLAVNAAGLALATLAAAVLVAATCLPMMTMIESIQ